MSPLAAWLLPMVFLAVGQFHAQAWIQGVDLPLPREVDPEHPVAPHETDCHVYYVYNYPMTCGPELVFHPKKLACVRPRNVASVRPECAKAEAKTEGKAEEKTGAKAEKPGKSEEAEKPE